MFRLSLDDVLGVKQWRKVAPKNLAEKDPVKEHFSDEYFSEVPQKSDHESEYDDVRDKKNFKTSDGNLNVVRHGIRKKTKITCSFPCPVCKTNHKDVIFGSNSHLNKHMKEDHPTFHFQCVKCDKEYGSYNACYKHIVRSHYLLRHKCEVCGKGFPYPKELTFHMHTHTKQGLIPCTWPKCKKLFRSNKSMFQHLEAHSEKKWYCKVCEPACEFDTYSNLRQHNKGFHNPPSFKAYCGTMWKWPYQCTRHQNECDLCKEIKASKDDRPANPRKLPIHKGDPSTRHLVFKHNFSFTMLDLV